MTFNLSEKRKRLLREVCANVGLISIKEVFDMIEAQDKDFIRLLKKYFTTKQSRKFIDKLAGDNLK